MCSPFEGRLDLLFEKSLSRGLQPADDDLRDAFHQFVAEVMIALGYSEQMTSAEDDDTRRLDGSRLEVPDKRGE